MRYGPNWRNLVLRTSLLSLMLLVLSAVVRGAEPRPNVMFIIADDASRHFGQAYGCDWVQTPNIERLATAGLIFDNAYVPTSKCAPTRAAILTGRNPWQNGEAANHQNHFPPYLISFTEVLRQRGVYCGSSGKVWGPGSAVDETGKKRDFALSAVKGPGTPGERFSRFLSERPAGSPFFYWHGSSDPHRGYEQGSGLAAGKKRSDIDRVPAYWPDNDTVRSDLLDYAIEMERFDAHVGELLSVLESSGEATRTLVIVTSDHGMPFPRVKGHTFDDAHRVPLVMSWPDGIAMPGRRVADLVSAIDFAPTFLEVFGAAPTDSGMEPVTGRSMLDLLRGEPTADRPFLLIGRERNDVYARRGSPYGLGYPARGIRMGDYLYVRNFAPDRWPCGDPDLGLLDTDASPTKSLIEQLGEDSVYWQHAFGKRPEEQLFNVVEDPDCVTNLATDPTFAVTSERLRATLMQELERQQDPRVTGQGDVFDQYTSVKPVPKNWPEKIPESFEKKHR